MVSKNDIAGLEYDWVAVDVDGRIAVFSTAGAGEVPSEFLESIDKHEQVIEYLLNLEPVAEAISYPPVADGLKNTWRDLAERGVFAYDCSPNGGAYELVGVPGRFRSLEDLPEVLATAASRTRFSKNFSALPRVLLNEAGVQ